MIDSSEEKTFNIPTIAWRDKDGDFYESRSYDNMKAVVYLSDHFEVTDKLYDELNQERRRIITMGEAIKELSIVHSKLDIESYILPFCDVKLDELPEWTQIQILKNTISGLDYDLTNQLQLTAQLKLEAEDNHKEQEVICNSYDKLKVEMGELGLIVLEQEEEIDLVSSRFEKAVCLLREIQTGDLSGRNWVALNSFLIEVDESIKQ